MTNYKWGIYFNWSWRECAIGVGVHNWTNEKYIFIDILFLEIAIGKTSA